MHPIEELAAAGPAQLLQYISTRDMEEALELAKQMSGPRIQVPTATLPQVPGPGRRVPRR